MKMIKVSILIVAVMLLISACSQEPATIHYGSDECQHCKMMITDSRFAAQLVTEKGKALKFDAIECLAAYEKNSGEQFSEAKLWVSNYETPGEWLPIPGAQFVKSEVIKSPMGASLLALPSPEVAQNHIREKAGTLLSWEEVKNTKMKM